MASSPHVYDLLVEHAAADGAAAEEFAGSLRDGGLRLWLPGRSAAGADDAGAAMESATESSRAAVRLIGAAGLTSLVLPAHPVVVLVPRCPVSARDVTRAVPDAVVVDFRDGFDDPRAWSGLRAVLRERASEPVLSAHPSLHHAELKARTAASYDRIAEKFAAQWYDHPPVRPLELFAGFLPRAARVLDAGCGPGHHARFLAGLGHDVVGMDISAGMLRIARSRLPSVTFLRRDIQDPGFPPGTFDGVWCAGAAMHIPREEVVGVLRGFRRLIRPGGVVGVNMQIGRRSEIVEYDDDRRFFEYYRGADEIARLAAQAGLRAVAADIGTTSRNTHELDLRLTWATVVAVPR